MNAKARILSLVTYVVLSVALILLFDWIWPDNRVLTTIVPLVVGGLITHFIRKAYDFIFDYFNKNKVEPFLGISLKVSHTFRKMTGYGASCGEVNQAGHYKANYDVELELIVTIQNESPETIYELEVSFVPNLNLSKYKCTLIDQRENKLQPLEGNKHFDFILRMNGSYYDVYSYDVDKETQNINNVGKGISLLNGSVLNLKYCDAKHKAYTKTEVIA